MHSGMRTMLCSFLSVAELNFPSLFGGILVYYHKVGRKSFISMCVQ
jgi:hypothetical protein